MSLVVIACSKIKKQAIYTPTRSSLGTRTTCFNAQSLMDSSFVLELTFISWPLQRDYLQLAHRTEEQCSVSLGRRKAGTKSAPYLPLTVAQGLKLRALTRFHLLTVAEVLPTVQTSQVLSSLGSSLSFSSPDHCWEATYSSTIALQSSARPRWVGVASRPTWARLLNLDNYHSIFVSFICYQYLLSL